MVDRDYGVIPQGLVEVKRVKSSWVDDCKVMGESVTGEIVELGEYTDLTEASNELLNLHETVSGGEIHIME